MPRWLVAVVAAMVAVPVAVFAFGAASSGSSPVVDPTVKQAFIDAGNCGNWSCARAVFKAAGLAAPPPTTTAPSSTTQPPTTTSPATTSTAPTTTTALPTTTTTQVPGGAKPNASNTGVPPGTTLQASGIITVTTPGTVISGKLVTGCILVQASNVTIKNTKILGGCYNAIDIRPWDDGDKNLIIQDVEVDGRGADNCIAFHEYTAIRVNLHGCADGAKVGDNTIFRDSYIHDLTNSGGCHCDALQSTGGDGTEITNTVLGGPLMLGDEFEPLVDILIQGSWLNGGLWGGWNQSTGTRPTNMRVTNNVISSPIVYVAPSTIWTGNTTPGGQPIPHP